MANIISPFESLNVDDALKKLTSNSENGLSSEEAKKRLQEYGLNTIEEKKESFFKKIFQFFWGPIPWMIEIAAILSGLLERWPDFILIVALLLINAILGFFHEYQADNAINALKKTLALKAFVLRDKKWQEIDASALVPGDIVSVKLGNIIPADIKLVSGDFLSVDQSALTGESLPVNKKISDMAYSSTIVKMGEMIGVVTATGVNSFFGKTATLVQSAKTVSHFQMAIQKIGRFLIISTLSIAFILLLTSLFRIEYDAYLHQSFAQVAIFILVVIIAGIPVALPAIMSVTMAIGAHMMAKMKAIVSKLIAIEELSGMQILCSDKTGTLTKNELTVGELIPFENTSNNDLITFAALASKFNQQDAIDFAITSAIKTKESLKKYKCEKFIPFDPINKRSEATISFENKQFFVCKGAPQVILTLSNISKDNLLKINTQINDLALKGYRTLGVAKKETDNWQFLGLIPLFDPPRDDTKQTIIKTKELGISVKMVTGDHIAIAKEIATNVGINNNIVPMNEVFNKDKNQEEQERLLTSADGFAEVFPEHKFKIVKAYQNKKYVTGMTGDGVNDAPALKQADIGIAVSGATDAARSAADLVLTEPGLIVITRAIEEARKIFGRLKSYAMYRISETCRLLLFLLLSVVIFDSEPLTAIMIILIALLNDIPIMTIAYDHIKPEEKPTFWDMKEILTISIGLSIIGVISTFGLYWIGLKIWQFSISQCRTLAFMGILCGGNLTIYLTRNRKYLFSFPFPEYRFILATMFSQIIGTIVSVYGLNTNDFVGIGWEYVLYAWVYILAWFVICMFTKALLYKIIDPYEKDTNSFLRISKKMHSHTT
jgi:H+-transporting ATPase